VPSAPAEIIAATRAGLYINSSLSAIHPAFSIIYAINILHKPSGSRFANTPSEVKARSYVEGH
jgi:hypothetical protein